MRILVLHNQYQQRGGEDVAVEAELGLLRGRGHDVQTWIVDNRGIQGPRSTLKTAMNLSYSRESRQVLHGKLGTWKPDVVHVHNFFPLLTPSVYDACADAEVPVIQTLHNYRLLCANALLLRNSRPCELCVTGSAYNGAIHACYRDSRLGSLAVARMLDHHRKKGTWRTKVSRFIALTEFAREKFIEGGVPADKILLKPNFLPDPLGGAPSPPLPQGDFALYVGRLSPEKGIQTLVEAWQQLEFPLHVIGDGPLLDYLRSVAPSSVQFLGAKTPAEVANAMKGAAFLVIPSQCYEGFPMVAVEAMALGLPLVTSDLGGIGRFVPQEEVGVVFRGEAALTEACRRMWMGETERREYSLRARQAYLRHFTPEANYSRLMEIYAAAMQKP